MFIVHVAFSMVLVLLLPFTKFAHAIYRIVALYIHALKPVAEATPQQVETAGAD
jgi:nitrate reductase gamma subunit